MIGLTCANSTHANNLMESSTRFALPVYPKTDSRNMSNYSRAGKSVAIHSRKITAKNHCQRDSEPSSKRPDPNSSMPSLHFP